jgi:hydroxyacyl-ACP dehydratase HTD2-like protein with hotdog domain
MLSEWKAIQVGSALCSSVSTSYLLAERLVHGPLTALMLLETVKFYHRSATFKSFEYRARNPVIVNRPVTIHGKWVNETSVELWTLDEDGVVGMTGSVTILQPNRQQ